MKHTRPMIALVVLFFMVVACGRSAGGNESNPMTGPTLESGGQAESPTKAPTEVLGELFLSASGIGRINLLTDVQSAGEKPLFKWEPVSGTDRYQLMVFDEAGEPYWAWEGAQTQVYMGGSESQPPADSSGPSVGAGYSWAVVAYDASGQILASSEIKPISP